MGRRFSYRKHVLTLSIIARSLEPRKHSHGTPLSSPISRRSIITGPLVLFGSSKGHENVTVS